MNKELTYTLCYTPDNKSWDKDVDYVCSDGKIHFRFRDFDKEQIIVGFERKLTYLLTYLMNYSYLPTIIGDYDLKTLIQGFLKTSDLAIVLHTVKSNIHNQDFKGFNASKNYKKSNLKYFGNVDKNCFPLEEGESGIVSIGSLKTFLTTLKISLEEYLFNDGYFIVIHANKDQKLDAKFINKKLRKENRQTIVSNLEQLW